MFSFWFFLIPDLFAGPAKLPARTFFLLLVKFVVLSTSHFNVGGATEG